MKYNYLVILEGADGAGKGTQLEAIKKVLLYNKLQFSIYDFPRYNTFWGKNIANLLNGELGDVRSISPYLKTLFYILDQADASKQIRKDLSNGKLVLCNRYVSSNQIFQSACISDIEEKKQFLAWLDIAAFEELNAVRPDLVVGLYADPKVAFRNIEKKVKRGYTDKKRDENEKNIVLQTQVAEELKSMCTNNPNWGLVEVTRDDHMRPVGDICNDILQTIQRSLDIKLNIPK